MWDLVKTPCFFYIILFVRTNLSNVSGLCKHHVVLAVILNEFQQLNERASLTHGICRNAQSNCSIRFVGQLHNSVDNVCSKNECFKFIWEMPEKNRFCDCHQLLALPNVAWQQISTGVFPIRNGLLLSLYVTSADSCYSYRDGYTNSKTKAIR